MQNKSYNRFWLRPRVDEDKQFPSIFTGSNFCFLTQEWGIVHGQNMPKPCHASYVGTTDHLTLHELPENIRKL